METVKIYILRKKIQKYVIFWGVDFKSAGVVTPATPPPVGDAPDWLSLMVSQQMRFDVNNVGSDGSCPGELALQHQPLEERNISATMFRLRDQKCCRRLI